MPNYKRHIQFNLLLILPLLLAIPQFFYPLSKKILILFAGSFAYASCFLHPDLDLAHKISPLSLRGILSLPFRLYSRIFHHRGLSHTLLFGTATRLLWLGGFFFLIILLFGLTRGFSLKELFYSHKAEFYALLTGIFLADFFHLLLDGWPFAKKR